MPVCEPPTSAARVCSSITISSSEALPARSPIPLIAHSTCRAPACSPANELATARPEVVVAVDRQHDVAQPGRQLVQPAQERRVLLGHRVADGVGDVDRRRALVDRDLDDLGGVLDVGARGVHRGELDVVDQRRAWATAARAWPLTSSRVEAQLVLDVDVRRRDERVDPRPLGVAYRPVGGIDVPHMNAREAGDDGALDLAGDRLHGLEVARRGDREAGLDDVDPQPRELVRDLELLARVQRDPRRLLAVSQGGVEDDYAVVIHVAPLVGLLTPLLAGFAASRPPRAIPPEGGGEEGGGRAGTTCGSKRYRSRPRGTSPPRPPSRRTRRRGARRAPRSGGGSR